MTARRFVFWATLSMATLNMASLGLLPALSGSAQAQVTNRRVLSTSIDRHANLEEQLTNRLKAVANDQRAFLRFVINLVRERKLESSLVVAIERYALRRNPSLPFLIFERALRYEAQKRGIALPAVRQFATTRILPMG